MMPDLDFDGHNTLYATHGMHSYAAKCPPQLARYAIETYSHPGDVVLDPMVGSGTTLVETHLSGRHGIGIDIDPLSCLIARVKSTVISDHEIEDAQKIIVDQFKSKKIDLYLEYPIPRTDRFNQLIDFPNREYWFTPQVQSNLVTLSYILSNIEIREEVRNFFGSHFHPLY
jgi:hypothetical protein